MYHMVTDNISQQLRLFDNLSHYLTWPEYVLSKCFGEQGIYWIQEWNAVNSFVAFI